MIKHIVMFQLKEKNEHTLQQLVSALESLAENIETLQFLEVGVDFRNTERSYDVVLTTHFANSQDLQTYAEHPQHLPVVELVREICSHSIVIDYEC